MIVIAIVLAIAAVAFPSLWGTRESVIWSQAVASIESAAETARAESMRRGVPVTLAIVDAGPGGQELWMWAFKAGDVDAEAADSAPPGWRERVFVLPRGVRLDDPEAAQAGVVVGDFDGDFDASDAVGVGQPAEPVEPRAWVVFVPTGEAWVVHPQILVGSGTRQAAFSVSAWSGRMRSAAVAAEAEEGEDDETLRSEDRAEPGENPETRSQPAEDPESGLMSETEEPGL